MSKGRDATTPASSLVTARPHWVDVAMLENLSALRKMVDEAIISVHRINAINTAGGEIRPWTDEQFDFVERERLLPIARLVRAVAPQVGE